jgi:hypothetical protein
MLYAGATPTQAVDAYFLREVGMPVEQYAEARGTRERCVRANADKAPEVFDS